MTDTSTRFRDELSRVMEGLMKSFEARDRDDPVEYDGPVHVRVMKSGRIVFHLPDERAGTEPGDPHA